jgi:hypothetical protein
MMATLLKPKTIKPKYKNTVVCQTCTAEYKVSKHWHRGYRTGGRNSTLSNNFVSIGHIKEDVCPMCRTPRNENK